jgi:hypothetical protein
MVLRFTNAIFKTVGIAEQSSWDMAKPIMQELLPFAEGSLSKAMANGQGELVEYRRDARAIILLNLTPTAHVLSSPTCQNATTAPSISPGPLRVLFAHWPDSLSFRSY